jgi:hypothetical protein
MSHSIAHSFLNRAPVPILTFDCACVVMLEGIELHNMSHPIAHSFLNRAPVPILTFDCACVIMLEGRSWPTLGIKHICNCVSELAEGLWRCTC